MEGYECDSHHPPPRHCIDGSDAGNGCRPASRALLAERPEVLNRLLRLLGLARWPMRYLMRHPGVIDELADERLLHSRFDAAEFAAELEARHEAWERSGQADPEALLDTLRRAHHAEVFRTLVRDVESHITVEEVADELSALADATLARTLAWTWKHLKQAHRPEPRFAVIAYGKLGGKELGYGSDLDVVFLYDDEDERAAEVYGAFTRKLIGWLTLRTAAGELFEIDTALRPNGNSGMLVTSMSSFEKYQSGRGSNTAWTWEHQAMTRARMVPPRCPASPGSLPPEGVLAALGRPDGSSVPPMPATAPDEAVATDACAALPALVFGSVMSAPGPLRGTLFLEGQLAFTGVFRQRKQCNLAFGEGHGFFEGHGFDLFHGVQPTADGRGRFVQQAAEQPVQATVQIGVDVVHQANFQRFGTGERFAGDAHLDQLAPRDQVLQHTEYLRRKHANLDFRQTKHHVGCGHSQVTHAHQAHATRHAGAVDPRHQGHA